MNWTTFLANTLVPFASVVSTATVAVWTKRLDTKARKEDRDHALILDYEKRAGEEKKAILKKLISATLHVKRAAEPLAGTELNEETLSQRRAEAIRQLYEFRARMGLDDGIAELMIYAAEPVRDLADSMLNEWDRQFREHGYSLKQLDVCKIQLLEAAGDVEQGGDSGATEGQDKWIQLKDEETSWLKRLGDESDLDVEALLALCHRVLKAAHTDLRGGYGIAT